MIDNKKSGIRLRHLEQQNQVPEIRRDPSPNNVNRKKIFERLPEQRLQNKVVIEEPVKIPKNQSNEFNNNKEFQQLVETLKKKSMELELRDNMIKSLNREIDGLNKQLQVKDRHISKLVLEIERLERLSTLAKEITSNEGQSFQSFKDQSENNAFVAPQQHFTVSNEANPQRKRFGSTVPSYQPKEDISLFNINSKQSSREQILSPFMALNSKKNDSAFESQITVKQDNNRKISYNKLPNAFEEQSAFKKKAEFDMWKGNDRKISTSGVATRQLQKFDIFGQNDYKSQIRGKGNLQIDNSRQFKFQDFDPNQFQDFGENSY